MESGYWGSVPYSLGSSTSGCVSFSPDGQTLASGSGIEPSRWQYLLAHETLPANFNLECGEPRTDSLRTVCGCISSSTPGGSYGDDRPIISPKRP